MTTIELEFCELRVERFKSIIDPLIFTLSAYGPGLFFMKGRNQFEPDLGSNGAGKSTLWDALCWCLFGRTRRGLRNPDVTPWYSEGTTSVIVYLKVNGDIHKVRRTVNPNRLTLDDRKVGQEQIVRLIGVDFPVFVHTVLLGSNPPLLFDLDAAGKMRVISEALDLERWDDRAEHAKKKLFERESRLVSSQAELDGLLQSSKATDDLLSQEKKRAESWQQELDEKIDDLKREIARLEKEHGRQQKILDQAKLDYDGAGTEHKACQVQVDERLRDLTAAQNFHNKAEANLALLRGDYKRIWAELEGLGEGDTCPTCGQSLKGTSLHKHKAGIRDELRDIKHKLDVGIPHQLVADVSLKRRLWEAAIKERDRFSDKADVARSTMDRLIPVVATFEVQTKNAQKLIADSEGAANPHRKAVQTLTQQRRRLVDDIAELEQSIKKQTSLVARTRFWATKGFKEIKLYQLEEFCDELELETNEMLADVGLTDYWIDYDTEKETKKGELKSALNVMIHCPDDKEAHRWESYSGGESQRMRLIGTLAFSQVLLNQAGVRIGLQVFDEPTEHLSEEGVEDLCPLLRERADRLKQQIWFIEPRAVESRYFTGKVTVTKTKGRTSRL